jgi:aminoglycoside/choline kinase family phosphotransferase
MEVELLGNYVKQRSAADHDFDPAGFIRVYATVAAQRASKILGIFARLNKRDGKPQYLRHIPRVWGYLQRSLAHPSLEALRDWYTEHVPVPQALREPQQPGGAAAQAQPVAPAPEAGNA